jgi:hypothetical protein
MKEKFMWREIKLKKRRNRRFFNRIKFIGGNNLLPPINLHFRFRMEYINFLQIVSKIGAFIWPQDSHGKADDGPQMDGLPGMVPDFA